MREWKYKAVPIERVIEVYGDPTQSVESQLEDQLNALGSRGWEMVGITRIQVVLKGHPSYSGQTQNTNKEVVIFKQAGAEIEGVVGQ